LPPPPVAGVPGDKVATCAGYARAMAGNQNRGEWVSYGAKIKELCPGVGFECTTVNQQPAQDKCVPFAITDPATFYRDVRLGFAPPSRP